MTRNFFGSGRGKGPADGTSAVVKQSAYKAVKSGKIYMLFGKIYM